MLFWLWPTAAEAHVRWFVDSATVTIEPYRLTEPIVLAVIGLVIAGLIIGKLLQPVEQKLWQRLNISQQHLWVARWLGLVIILVGIWFVHNWLELLPYLGYISYILLIQKQPKLALAVLAAGVGLSLALLAFDEKLLHPELAATFLLDHPWNAGIPVRVFILLAGAVELTLGLLLTFRLATGLASIMIILAFIATAVTLGAEEILGHLPIATALILLLLERPSKSWYTAPMCAIAGFVSIKPRPDGPHIVKKMLTAMAHRGPDGRQIKSFPSGATLGHNRLSILDLSQQAAQPMCNKAGDLGITYNGEIYNYKELQQWLGSGIKYRSHSDTEVLLKCYEHEELNCLPHLNGMFAFGVWDERTKRLVLARDQIGVKPLYWSANEDYIVFASELRGILATDLVARKIKLEAIHHYLSLQAVPPPLTMISNVQLLESGHYLVWQNGQVKQESYFSITFSEDDSLGDKVEPYIEQTRALLDQAIHSQRQSDVPIGIALSGGIDSAAILSGLAPVSGRGLLTYTLRDETLPKNFRDDGYYAKIMSETFNSEHTELFLKPNELLHYLPEVIWAQGQPSLRNMLAYFLLKKIKHQVKVLFYGTGGDELFAGYGTAELIKQFMRKGKLMNGFRPLIQQLFNLMPSLYNRFSQADYTFQMLAASGNLYRQRQIVDWIFLDRDKQQIYHPAIQQRCQEFNTEQRFKSWAGNGSLPAIKVHQQLDYLGIICEHLVQLDAVAMANGIETRVPFMDKNVVSFAASLPAFVLAPGGRDHKFLLRQAYKQALPQTIIQRPKTGFHISFENYMADYFEPLCRWLLNESNLEKYQIFSYQRLQGLMTDYFYKRAPQHKLFEKLSLLVNLELWLKIFIEQRDVNELSLELVERCTTNRPK